MHLAANALTALARSGGFVVS